MTQQNLIDDTVIVGFTGRRDGMSDAQRAQVIVTLGQFNGQATQDGKQLKGLHGDAIGADEEFFKICVFLRITCLARPCDHKDRAHTASIVIAEPTTPMVRNRAIVKDSHVMIACPPTEIEVPHSGTWATIKYMIKAGKPLHIVWPDGSVGIQ